MRKRFTIDYAKQVGAEYNLTLVSTEYKRMTDEFDWRCDICDYIFKKTLTVISRDTVSKSFFEAEANNIKCNKCRNNYIVEKIDEKIASMHIDKETGKTGRLLSKIFTKQKDRHLFQCEKGHIFKTSIFTVLHGSWCPKCSGLERLTLQQMQEIAKKRGGECLSTEYSNNMEHLKWRCKFGHFWDASAYQIKTKGHWCPHCCGSLSERMTRVAFQTIFEKEFFKIKPKWLLSDIDSRMELDGYCRELGIAFEHNGTQHYDGKFIKNMSKEKLERNQKLDALKIELCKQNDVKLIVVPALHYKLKIEDLKEFIKQECMKQNIKLPENFDDIHIDYDKAYSTPDAANHMKEIERIIKKKTGELLEGIYINAEEKSFKIRCDKGHIFQTSSTYSHYINRKPLPLGGG